MNKPNRVLAWSVLIIIILLGYGYFSTDAHEQAHGVICTYFGGNVINKTVTMFGGETNCGNITGVNSLSFYESQSMVEAFGYQLQTAMLTIILLVWGIGLILCLKGERE
jgi:hypothetical protein